MCSKSKQKPISQLLQIFIAGIYWVGFSVLVWVAVFVSKLRRVTQQSEILNHVRISAKASGDEPQTAQKQR